MLKLNEPCEMWAWVCPVTGMVLDECWGATEGYPKNQSEKYLGKRRAEYGEMRLCRVTVTLCTDEETEKSRADFAAWKNSKEKRPNFPESQ